MAIREEDVLGGIEERIVAKSSPESHGEESSREKLKRARRRANVLRGKKRLYMDALKHAIQAAGGSRVINTYQIKDALERVLGRDISLRKAVGIITYMVRMGWLSKGRRKKVSEYEVKAL